jgi:hypothetical protein
VPSSSDGSTTSSLLDLRAADVGAELRLPISQLEVVARHPLLSEGAAIVDLEGEMLRNVVTRDFHVTSLDGANWRVQIGDFRYAVDDQVPVVVVAVTLTPPQGASARAFRVVDDVIGNEVPNHGAWIGVRSDFANGFVSGPPAFVGIARPMHHAVVVDHRGGGTLRGFRAVFRLGMQHIAEGTDHLLFLLALLLPAPLFFVRSSNGRGQWDGAGSVRASCVRLLRVVTAFTVGHSLTLLIGTLGWLRLPGVLVETLIAASILVSAVHASRPLFPGREPWIAAGFGLVHGLAFAGALTELHLDAAHLALAVLGFDLGIEAMQLVVVAVTFPWLLLLARSAVYPAFRIGGAVVAGTAAVGWIAQRTLGLSNPFDSIVTRVSTHPVFLLAGLALVSLAATLIPDGRRRASSFALNRRISRPASRMQPGSRWPARSTPTTCRNRVPAPMRY